MNATDTAAWWGAVIATLVFAWDIFKWLKSGTSLRLTATSNMQLMYDEVPKPTDAKYILVDISNTGDMKTTITHLVGVCYTSFWRWLFWQKPDVNFFIPTPEFAKELPYILEPGEKWSGSFKQTEELESWLKTGRFYCGIHHSNSSKPQLRRVKFIGNRT